MKYLVYASVWLAVAQVVLAASVAGEEASRVPENVYRGELISYPGPWSFLLGRASIILVSDDELEALADLDRVINISLGLKPHETSLRQICERAQAAGRRTLVLAFDHFFSQYRPGQAGKVRRLTPDKDEYIERIAAISKFAQQYGLGMELSLLSPLEIGPAYARATGESGVWMHYRKGLRDPKSGEYSVQLWRQRRWANNKGPLDVEDAGVRVFAFREHRVNGTPYRVVNPKEIVEISNTAEIELWENTGARSGDYDTVRIRVHGKGGDGAEGLDRVLVVQMYRTPEMDYFSDRALPYLKGLADRYADAGVKINALYADEMHIQQNWRYHGQHDHGEFALRYVSPGFERAFADRYGDEYRDFAKYLAYFASGQEDFAADLSAKRGAIHVFGATPEAIRATALFRARYYHMLQDGVVDLFTAAKHHLERRMGQRLHARAHATWAESPTCDKWETGQEPANQQKYEYTSNFVWSNTVQQAASACYDYFKWGDFLTGNGNDHAEGGWLDRNYYGMALACSTGILNEVPNSYAAHWGMPGEVSRRRLALVNAYGVAARPWYSIVQEAEHRDVDVLMLYPMDLVAVEERFGSWMTQYGYANLVTQDKLLERGSVVDGAVKLAGRRFTTLVTLFEPFPSQKLLTMMQQLAETGGKVIWSGPPPVLLADGGPALPVWQDLTGANYQPEQNEGVAAPGKQVVFEGALANVPPMTILTDLLVDHVYSVTPRENVETVARVKDRIVGTRRSLDGGGSVTVLGCRPRDDQAKSLGYESRHWFEILRALGAYPGTGTFAGVNDNTEYLSRTTDYLACRFPNGAIAIAPHLRDLEESWPGGFARKQEEDKAIVERLTLPSERVSLRDFKVEGHTVTYEGEQAVTFRVNDEGALIAFCGASCKEISIDGRLTVFADEAMPLVAWAPVEPARRVEGGAVLIMCVYGTGTVRIPAVGLPDEVHVVAEGSRPGSRGVVVPSRVEDGVLAVTVSGKASRRWLYVVAGGGS